MVESRELIGVCQLHSIHPIYRSAELHIRIGEPAYRGQGFGTEAVSHLVRFGFEDLNLRRIFVQVFSENTAARTVYSRCGFVEEGLLRSAAFVGGRYLDIVVMAMLDHQRPGIPKSGEPA